MDFNVYDLFVLYLADKDLKFKVHTAGTLLPT